MSAAPATSLTTPDLTRIERADLVSDKEAVELGKALAAPISKSSDWRLGQALLTRAGWSSETTPASRTWTAA
jgi:hypothetical protein